MLLVLLFKCNVIGKPSYQSNKAVCNSKDDVSRWVGHNPHALRMIKIVIFA